MAVLATTFWRVTPGANAEFMQAASGAKRIHQRMGAEVVLVSWSSAGALSGSISYGMNFADLGAWARFSDSALQDAEWQAWVAENMGSANPTATMLSQATSSDLPGFEAPTAPAPGSFMLAAAGHLAPGHSAAEVHGLTTEVAALANEHGAGWTRALRVGAGGENTLRFTTIFGFENAQAYAEWQVKYLSDPRGQAANERVFGASSPFASQSMSYGRVLAV